jgi:hypothetical protein
MAKKFLSNKKYAGARVLSNRVKHDGSVEEKVIFEETQLFKDSQLLKISTVEQIKVYCEKPQNFFSLESRIVFNRIFRSYLGSVTLTPTEVLHNHKEIQRRTNRDSLMFSATSHVVQIQSSGGAQGAKNDKNRLSKLLIKLQLKRNELHHSS